MTAASVAGDRSMDVPVRARGAGLDVVVEHPGLVPVPCPDRTLSLGCALKARSSDR